MIERLVRTFYGRARLDPLIGPMFESRVHEWDGHFGRLCAFWSSVALMSGRYHGQPMVAHLPLAHRHAAFRSLARDLRCDRTGCLSAGGGGPFPRPRLSDRRQPRTGHCGPEGRDQAEADAAGANLFVGEGRYGDAVSLLLLDQGSSDAIKHVEDGFVVDAKLVADKLGLSPDAFWREMKRGIVYGVVERGEGDDAGRMRLTFRYRARSWSMTLEDMAQ